MLDGTGTSYPAGIAVAPNGNFIYVAENVSDSLAVVDASTGGIAQRFASAWPIPKRGKPR
jgi:DNA-binding beta-propeller fold protein YncE